MTTPVTFSPVPSHDFFVVGAAFQPRFLEQWETVQKLDQLDMIKYLGVLGSNLRALTNKRDLD